MVVDLGFVGEASRGGDAARRGERWRARMFKEMAEAKAGNAKLSEELHAVKAELSAELGRCVGLSVTERTTLRFLRVPLRST